MSSRFPNGTVFAISGIAGSPVAVSAISNASPGVATATSHGFTDGDILVLTVASTRLDQRVARVDNASTNAFDIEGINTTNTSLYPSGFGLGTAAEYGSFVSLSQTTDTQSTGGEQQYFQWVYLEDGKQRQRKTFKNARAISWTGDVDETLSWFAALQTADDDGLLRVLRATMPSGRVIYWPVEVSFDGEPTFTANQNQQVTAIFSFMNPVSTAYSA
jgi:hypothetical protein